MKTSSILTIAGVTFVSGAIAYAVYFDSKRRNDAAFRKKLRASPHFPYLTWNHLTNK